MNEPSPAHCPLDRRSWLWCVLFGGLVVGTAVYASSGAPRELPVIYVWVFGVSTVWAMVTWLAARGTLNRLDSRQLVSLLVLTAACLRLAAALAPTSLSDDVFRYVWDGRVLVEGLNPYQFRPNYLFYSGRFFDGLYHHLNSPDYYTVYPPLAQAVFGMAARSGEFFGLSADRLLRVIFGLVDCVTVALLVGLLRDLRRSPAIAALYAWNPLVFWEIAGGGHSEALMLPFLLLAIRSALRGNSIRTGLWLGLTGLAKLTGLTLAPVLAWYLVRRLGSKLNLARGLRAAAVAAFTATLVLVLGYLPFWFEDLLHHQQESLSLYFGTFIFDAPIFEMARSALGYVEGETDSVTAQIIPALRIGLLTILLLTSLVVNGRRPRLLPGLFAVAVAQLLLSPVFHPWYLVLPLLLGVACRSFSVHWLGFTASVTYLVYDPKFETFGRVSEQMMWVQFAPFALLIVADLTRAAVGFRTPGAKEIGENVA